MNADVISALKVQNRVYFWGGLLVAITTLLTLTRVLYFSKANRLVVQSVPLILILSLILLIGLVQCFFIHYVESFNRKDGTTYNYISTTMAEIYLLQPITTYLFAFKYF